MKKTYLFVYDDQVGTREELKNALNKMDAVQTWRYDLPHCFYVISENSANEIYNQFEAINGTKGRFMFIEVTENRQGQMLPDTWYLLTNKHNKPEQA